MPDTYRIALIIGVDVYYHTGLDGRPSLPSLLSCKKDAIDFYDLLSSEKLGYKIFGNGPIIGSNLDKNIGYTTINESINNFFLDAQPRQTLLFYFSGHGIPWAGDVYLATPQTNPKRPMIAGFSLRNLTTMLMQESKSARIVCIIDACYSGAAKLPDSKGIIDKGAAESDAVAANDTYSEILNIPKAEGKCLLLSSQAYERSRASENDNSIYTKYIIEGLHGAKEITDGNGDRIPASIDINGNVTPETLHDYVYIKVANEVNQTPKIKSDKSSKIILAEYPHLSKWYLLELLKQANVKEVNKINEVYQDQERNDIATKDQITTVLEKLMSDGKYREAVNLYDVALYVDLNNPELLYGKGLALEKLKKYREAIKCYDKALEANPNDSTIFARRKKSRYKLRKQQMAKKGTWEDYSTSDREPYYDDSSGAVSYHDSGLP